MRSLNNGVLGLMVASHAIWPKAEGLDNPEVYCKGLRVKAGLLLKENKS